MATDETTKSLAAEFREAADQAVSTSKSKKPKSLAVRFQEAAQAVLDAEQPIMNALQDLAAALEELSEAHNEYVIWFDELTERQQEAVTGQKLFEIYNIEISDTSAITDAVEEIMDIAQMCLDADLPRDRR